MEAVNFRKTRRLGAASLSSELSPLRSSKGETKTQIGLSTAESLVDRSAKQHLDNLMGSTPNSSRRDSELRRVGQQRTSSGSTPNDSKKESDWKRSGHQKTSSYSGSLRNKFGAMQALSTKTSPSSLIPSVPRENSLDQSRRHEAEGRSKIPQVSQIVKSGSHTDRGAMVAQLVSSSSRRNAEQSNQHGGDNVPKLAMAKMGYLGFGSNGGIDAAKTDRPLVPSVAASTNQTRHGVALTARTQTPKKGSGTSRNSSRGGGSLVSSMSGPMSVQQVLNRYAELLTDFEQSEILHYPQIYFVGKTSHKVKGTPHSAYLNHGYDDERGDYATVAHDHIAYRYEIVSTLGKGSFGQVLKCFDHKTRSFVALKIIRNKKRFHHQAMIEVKVLDMLRRRDTDDSNNVVHLKEYFVFRNHLCITFELMSINLYELIKQNNFEGVSLGLTRRFAIQILTSLKFLRELRVVHCDLKPENILLKQPDRSAVKVIDFGSSCLEDETRYTYIQSRFYRAPEVILGLPYGTPIDMWSLGCILAELYTGCPIFPGENEQEQLLCIMEVLGVPPRAMLQTATKWKMFFDSSYRPRIVPSSRGKKRHPGSRDLASKIRCRDKLFLMFLEGCFRWEPHQRMTPEEALQHPWMTEPTRPATQRVQPTTQSTAAPAFLQVQQPRFKTGWNNSNSNGGKKNQQQVDSSGQLISSRVPETTYTRPKQMAPVVSTGVPKNRPPIQTILPKLLALKQN